MGSTTWAALPTPLTINFVVGSGESVLLLADISRTQHDATLVNTQFRIVVDGTQEVALTNTGENAGFNFVPLSFHGVASGLSAGSHTAAVEYATVSGISRMPSNHDGYGMARLTANTAPSTQLVTASQFATAPSSAATSTVWAALPTPLSITFTTTATESVLLLADISRVQHALTNVNTQFRILVDGTQEVALTNTGNAGGWAFNAITFHGWATGLSAGSHTAAVEYKTGSGSVHIPHHTADGRGYLRLTARTSPSTQLVTASQFATVPSPAVTSTVWAALPTPLSVTFTTAGATESVLLLADISRVQHAATNVNTEFRILVDGTQEAALTNTGNAGGWAFRALRLHGVATGLSAGSHTAAVEYKTRSGSVHIPHHTIDGQGYLRVTVLSKPPPPPPPSPLPSPPPPATCTSNAECVSGEVCQTSTTGRRLFGASAAGQCVPAGSGRRRHLATNQAASPRRRSGGHGGGWVGWGWGRSPPGDLHAVLH